MILLTLACCASGAYQVLAILASILHRLRANPEPSARPGVSILKPLRGSDPALFPALCSHAELAYPEFEILIGVQREDDPALADVERLRARFPHVAIRSFLAPSAAPNRKVGVLEKLGEEARYPVWVVNDADISVPRNYLDRLTAELSQPGTGLVTCLYRATAGSFAAGLEALGVATDFAPSVLVARITGVREFGLGSTLAFRAETLRRAGGFSSVRDYLADDYQIGRRIHSIGKRVELSRIAVSTHLEGTWREVWAHQVRWARTIRLSRSGYFGLPITNATLFAVLAAATGQWPVAVGLLCLRWLAGLASGALVLNDPLTLRWWWILPLRDLAGLAVWFAGAVGREVHWKGATLHLDGDGRIRMTDNASG